MKKFHGFLYHITRYNKWQVGDKLEFGGKENLFAKKMFETDFLVDDMDILGLFQKKSCKDFTKEEESKAKSYVYESTQTLRELVLENVRAKEFPNHPSRLECLYCVETFEEAKSWIEPLKRMHKSEPPLQIVKLKVKGKIFKGEGNLMLRNTLSLNSKKEMARQYWQGTENPVLPEILFVGKAEVKEILEEF